MAEHSITALSPLLTLVLAGLLFQMGVCENTGAGKLVRVVVCCNTCPVGDLATHLYWPESVCLTSIMIRDWLLLNTLVRTVPTNNYPPVQNIVPPLCQVPGIFCTIFVPLQGDIARLDTAVKLL